MIKNYEAKQNEMMKKQVERCKKEMDYLQKKLKENFHEDTKAMVKVMQEDNDTKERELVALKIEHSQAINSSAYLPCLSATMRC